VQNEYWNRAWVTLEIVLARHVSVLLDDMSFSLPDMGEKVTALGLEFTDPQFEQFCLSGGGRGVDLPSGIFWDQSLLYLLSWFRTKNCSIPHDRVFSLLLLCHEDDVIEVDYDTPNTPMALHVLTRSMKAICVCSAAVVATSLDVISPCPVGRADSRVPLLEVKLAESCYNGETMKEQDLVISRSHTQPRTIESRAPIIQRQRIICISSLAASAVLYIHTKH
jgi:hypothetical protein